MILHFLLLQPCQSGAKIVGEGGTAGKTVGAAIYLALVSRLLTHMSVFDLVRRENFVDPYGC